MKNCATNPGSKDIYVPVPIQLVSKGLHRGYDYYPGNLKGKGRGGKGGKKRNENRKKKVTYINNFKKLSGPTIPKRWW